MIWLWASGRQKKWIDFIESLHQSVSPLNATTVNQPVLLSGIRRFQANQGYAGSFIPAVWSVDGV